MLFKNSRRFQLSQQKIDLRDTPAFQDLMVVEDESKTNNSAHDKERETLLKI